MLLCITFWLTRGRKRRYVCSRTRDRARRQAAFSPSSRHTVSKAKVAANGHRLAFVSAPMDRVSDAILVKIDLHAILGLRRKANSVAWFGSPRVLATRVCRYAGSTGTYLEGRYDKLWAFFPWDAVKVESYGVQPYVDFGGQPAQVRYRDVLCRAWSSTVV